MPTTRCQFCGAESALASSTCPSCSATDLKNIFPTPDELPSPHPTLPDYTFSRIQAQQFWMGSPDNETGRDPDEIHHCVQISQHFWIGNTEVPQDLYRSVMRHNPSGFVGDHRPVEHVNWFDAVQFCNNYTRLKGREPAYTILPGNPPLVSWNRTANGFRLPTEAEWELAAKQALGAAPATQQAWYANTAQLETHGVGQWNKRTLSDMSGNVWEWCWDYYAQYPTEPLTIDPTGPEHALYRVARGGSWADDARVIRPANRAESPPDRRTDSIGFRIAYTEY